MMIEFKVTNSLNDVMFTAEVSDIYVSVLSRVLTPHVVGSKLVEPGTGNAGKNLEYLQTYQGLKMGYEKFKELMDQVFI